LGTVPGSGHPGGVRLTPTGPPIGGGGVPAGGIPGTPTKSGTPRIGQNSLFPGTPPSDPGFDARDPQIRSNSRFPGFIYVRDPPAGGGGTPRRPRKPPPFGFACRLHLSNLMSFFTVRLPRWTSPKCVANKREKTRNKC